MNKFLLLLFIGTVFLSNCHTEELDNSRNEGNSDGNSIEESVKKIKMIRMENKPNKSTYLLNETLELDGISVSVTYADGTVSNLMAEALPEKWITGFSSDKPFKEKEIVIHPTDVSEEIKVSFTVDILPILVEEGEIVNVIESDFKRIQIPEGIKSIRNEAFGNNQSLEEISLPSTLLRIGTYTFYGSNLKSVDFSKSVIKELPSGTFESCKKLAKVILPKTLKEIGGNAFYGTALLEEIEIPEGVEVIGYTAFSSSGLVSIKLPNTVRTIRRSFYNCDELKEVTVYGMNYTGNDLERSIIGESFQHCPNLETLQIPGGINQIGISVLGMCKVEKLTIPSNVERIEFNAFANVSSLQQVVLLGNKKKIIEDNAFPSWVQDDVLRQNNTLSR